MVKLRDTVEKTMFYGAKSKIFDRAKQLRSNPTEAELKVWNILRKKQILGLKFRFQHPINQFIADFYCHKINLVIEIDGGIHNETKQKERDEGRTYEMQKLGIEVLRFDNNDVMNDIERIQKTIHVKCEQMLQRLNDQPKPSESPEENSQ